MRKIISATTSVAILLLGAACADSDLSTPEGRDRAARLRAVADDINKHKWDSWQIPPPPPMMICSPVGGGTLMCQ
jgi:hypothetical protein